MRSRKSTSPWPLVIVLQLMFLVGCNVPAGTATALRTAQSTVVTITPPKLEASTMPSLPTEPPTFPTLTAEGKRALIVDMLSNNSQCDLPCWWIITPGQTSWQTVRDRFSTFGYVPIDRSLSTDTVAHGAVLDMPHLAYLFDYRVTLKFVEQKGIVQSVEIMSEVFGGTASARFARDWQRYSIDQVLNRYGVPSQVQLQLAPPIEPGAPPGYALTIVYEDRGFWIRYQGPATFDGTMVRACPSFAEVEYLVLRLQSPAAKTPVFRPDPDGYDRSLEEATGMSLKTFYDRFKDEGAQTCLEGSPTLPGIPSDK